MSNPETITVKSGDSYAIINKSDYDEKVHELYDGPRPADVVTDLSKNPSGTFSQPTPTDIRFPDKDKTEFENNHGAFAKKSAAEIREAEGMVDAPGGIDPDPALAQAVKDAEKAPDLGDNPAVDNESKSAAAKPKK